MKSKVGLVRGEDRRGNILQSLQLIGDDIDLAGKSKILIKPNFVSTTRLLAATHVDAVRAVLDYLRQRGVGHVTIAEGAPATNSYQGWANFGYLTLRDEYDVEFVDLNSDESVQVTIYDRNLRPLRARLARTVAESDFRISVAPAKTHDTVVVTLALKNLLVGSLISRAAVSSGSSAGLFRFMAAFLPDRVKASPFMDGIKARVAVHTGMSDKVLIHQGTSVINLNLYTLARVIPPHLSVIDGFVGMEGDGPAYGDPVDLRVAVASTDFVAADTLAAHLMGFDLSQIGYLWYCAQAGPPRRTGLGVGDLAQMEVRGAKVEECRRPFRPHRLLSRQLRWRSPAVERLVAASRVAVGAPRRVASAGGDE